MLKSMAKFLLGFGPHCHIHFQYFKIEVIAHRTREVCASSNPIYSPKILVFQAVEKKTIN